MRQETLTKGEKCLSEPVSQILPCPCPFVLARRAPSVEETRRRKPIIPSVARSPESRLMRKQPQRREIRITFLGKHSRQVHLNPCRPCEAGVIAQNAKDVTIRNDSPSRTGRSIQVLLSQPERTAPPPAVSKQPRRRFNSIAGCRYDNRNATIECCHRDWIAMTIDDDWRRRLKRDEP